MTKIVVVGSSNTDMVVKTSRFPEPGETIMGGDFFTFPGGKGANQAVAAARMGGEIAFICSLGDDYLGKNALENYLKEGIDTGAVLITEGVASGVALITVNHQGENEIVVAPGANALLSSTHLQSVNGVLENAEIILTQLETPLEVTAYLSKFCRDTTKKLIINPAPAKELPPEILDGLYLITPNQTEAKILTGIEVFDVQSAEKSAEILLKMGVKNIIITMGKKGAYLANEAYRQLFPAKPVEAVDTTAAGDVFNGVLTVQLAQNKPWKEAIEISAKAAAISVTRMGAQASAPFLHEIEELHKK